MPVSYLRKLTSHQSDSRAIRHLACYLAFIAGAINAGGLLAVHQYTSHMSGVMAAIADNLVLGSTSLVLDGIAAVLAFIAGSATTAILVNWGRRRALHSQFALPLLLEASLLLGFGLLGSRIQ